MNEPDEQTVRLTVRDMWRGVGTCATWEQISAWFAERDLAHYELLSGFAAVVHSEWVRYVNEPAPKAICDTPPEPLYLIATIPPVDPETFRQWQWHYFPRS